MVLNQTKHRKAESKMKTQKTVKLLVMALSLAILIGSTVCIMAGATAGGSLEIEAINIQHGDRTYVAIAVDAVGVDPATIEVNYSYGENTYAASYVGNIAVWAAKGDNTEYPVFSTVGIPAKDMGEDVIVEAHIKDSGATGATRNISVATRTASSPRLKARMRTLRSCISTCSSTVQELRRCSGTTRMKTQMIRELS